MAELGVQGSGGEALLSGQGVCACACVCMRVCAGGGELGTPGCSRRGRAWLGNTRTPPWHRGTWKCRCRGPGRGTGAPRLRPAGPATSVASSRQCRESERDGA